MDLNYETTNVIGLLGARQNQLLVPRYQREYSWSKNEAQTLLRDIINCLRIEGPEIEPSEYFFGTVLLRGTYGGSNGQYDIIDGQQRITTIVILLAAINSLMDKNIKEESDLSAAIESNDITFYSYKNKREYTTLSVESVNNFYSKYLFGTNEDRENLIPRNEADSSIKEVFNYFYILLSKEHIKNTFYNLPITETQDFSQFSFMDLVNSIYDQLSNLMVAIITTKSDNDATSIFESLNSKGKPLVQSDLIKNKIFSTLIKEQPLDTSKENWKKMKENLDSKETEDGTGTWVPVEEFIQIYWKTNISNAASKKIYLDFTNRYINTSADLSLFLTDLCTYSNEYKVLFGENNFSLFSADGSDQIKQYTNILVKTLKIKQAHPLLLQLIHVFKLKLIKEKLLKKTVKFLADFHLLYNGILTEPTNRLTSIYGPTSRTIRTILSDNDLELSDKANKIAKELQKMIVALQKLLPRTSEFENRIEGLSDLTYTNKIDTKNQKNNNERTKYILYSYTVEINNGRSISEMNIEHMLPDSPDDLNSISLGNLVFLEKKDNERIQNKPLADKLSTYQTSKNNNFSELFETGFFKSLDQSNPEAIINKRQNKILKTVYTRISAKERNIE